MAAGELPSEERVRELTADPRLSADDANRHADLFLRAGKLASAMMFLERSKDPSRLAEVKKQAVAMGDAFLLHWITKLDPQNVTEGEWREAGERALREGKFLFARDCFEKAGDAEKAQAAREDWLKIFPGAATSGPSPASAGGL